MQLASGPGGAYQGGVFDADGLSAGRDGVLGQMPTRIAPVMTSPLAAARNEWVRTRYAAARQGVQRGVLNIDGYHAVIASFPVWYAFRHEQQPQVCAHYRRYLTPKGNREWKCTGRLRGVGALTAEGGKLTLLGFGLGSFVLLGLTVTGLYFLARES